MKTSAEACLICGIAIAAIVAIGFAANLAADLSVMP